jgi:tRNA threonylcarbamoyladenosine biosynthesis protein TsaE
MYIESKDNMETYVSNSLAETEHFAREIAERVKESKFLALYGGMGMGKTAFVRGLVKALAPECLDLVHSPTFAIVNEYRGNEINLFQFGGNQKKYGIEYTRKRNYKGRDYV